MDTMKARTGRWLLTLGALSAAVFSLGAFRGDVESEAVPHSQLERVRHSLEDIGRSYEENDKVNDDTEEDDGVINMAIVSCGTKSRFQEVCTRICERCTLCLVGYTYSMNFFDR